MKYSSGFLFLLFSATVFAQSVPVKNPPLSPEERGDLYMARKMYREAAEMYSKNAGKSALMWDKAGIAYQQLSDLNAARKAYERAIKFDRKYADPVNNVGTIFYAEKKYRSAINRYQRAIQLLPDSAAFWSNLGTAWYARGRYDLMNDAYSKALQLDPDVFERSSPVGTRMMDRGVTDRARYHFELARLFASYGKNELAMQYLRKALEEGFKEKEKVEQAKEFSGLRETQEFKDLMALEPRVL